MELGLSLGETPKPFRFLEKPRDPVINANSNGNKGSAGFCMALSIGPSSSPGGENDRPSQAEADDEQERVVLRQQQQQQQGCGGGGDVGNDQSPCTDPPVVQLDLLPRTPVPRTHGFPWISSHNGQSLILKPHLPKKDLSPCFLHRFFCGCVFPFLLFSLFFLTRRCLCFVLCGDFVRMYREFRRWWTRCE